ncbi:MAG: hypothetical protein Q9M91_00085 [Candidatus Dojkabacteria bacterium]|nr:hypothetical protein [Candidatus Dojkabacteria bacterium]
MSVDGLNDHQNILAIITLLSLSLPVVYLKRKNLPAYLGIVYFVFLNGWIRKDRHTLVILTLAFFVLAYSAVVLLNNIKESTNDKERIFNKIMFLISTIFIFTTIFAFRAFNINLFSLDLRDDALSTPVYFNDHITNKWNVDAARIREEFREDYISNIRNGKKLLVLPWATHLPDVFGVDPIYIPMIHLYQSYTEFAEEESINFLDINHGEFNILIHNNNIDNRLYLSEMPEFILDILNNYKFVNEDNGSVLLYPNNEYNPVQCSESGNKTNMIKIKTDESAIKKLNSALVKPDEICISFTLDSGENISHRTFKSQLERGIIVSPYLENSNNIRKYLEDGISKKIELDTVSVYYCKNNESLEIKYIKELTCNL